MPLTGTIATPRATRWQPLLLAILANVLIGAGEASSQDCAQTQIICGAPLPNCQAGGGDPCGTLWQPGTNPRRPAEQATVGQALGCLKKHSSFVVDPRNRESGSPFDFILSNSYQTPDYADAEVSGVFEWAVARRGERKEDRCAAEQLLVEASYRKASAHGMFGDDRLLRGLNPQFLLTLQAYTNDPLAPGLLLLDSRACFNALAPDASSRDLCNSDADCPEIEECTSCRFNGGYECGFAQADGLSGAIQEFRRAEQAIIDAALALEDNKRFQDVDRLSGCRGGCASALLLRLGANKLRAQALRLDALWGRAAARGWPPKTAKCQNPDGAGDACTLDGDCDRPGELGRCAAPGTVERGFVLLRQAADEAFLEAGAAQSVYNQIVSPAIVAVSRDVDLIQAQMGEMNEVINRAVSGLTPFGLPPDYVPFMTEDMRDKGECFGSLVACEAGTSQGEAGSILACLDGLLGDNETGGDGLLAVAAAQQDAADSSIEAMTEAMRDIATSRSNLRSAFEGIAEEMFGVNCTEETCACEDPADFSAGRCLRLQLDEEGEIYEWQIAGLACTEPGTTLCDGGDRADGRIEIALQEVQGERLNLYAIDVELDLLDAKVQQTGKKFSQLQNISADKCAELRTNILESGNQVAAERLKMRSTGDEISALAGAAAAMSSAGTGVLDVVLSGGALAAATAAAAATEVAVKHQIENRRYEVEAQIQRIQTAKEEQSLAITCKADGKILEVEEADALFDLAQQRTRIELQRARQELALLHAVSEIARLGVEFRRRMNDVREAAEIERIWGAELEFANPLNYRLMALGSQLGARTAFRNAQQAVWMLLRAAAYDFVEPDFALTGGLATQPVSFAIPNCADTYCSEVTSGVGRARCTSDAECNASGTDRCVSSIVASDGSQVVPSCGLQAVFAARNVEDLRQLKNAALLKRKLTNVGDLACGSGKVCQKRLSLKQIFTNPLGDGQAGRRTLGDILAERAGAGQEAVLEFAIALDRGFEVCPVNGTTAAGEVARECIALGVAGLESDDLATQGVRVGSGPVLEAASGGQVGRGAENFWAQKLFGLKGVVQFAFGHGPGASVCRNADGAVINASITSDARKCTFACPAGQGPCGITTNGTSSVQVTLTQVEAGQLRTRNASYFADGAENLDQIIPFQIRDGDLFTEGRRLRPFSPLVNHTFGADETSASFQCSGRGAPVASPRWRMTVRSSAPAGKHRAVFEAIEDLKLIINFQARSLTPGT